MISSVILFFFIDDKLSKTAFRKRGGRRFALIFVRNCGNEPNLHGIRSMNNSMNSTAYTYTYYANDLYVLFVISFSMVFWNQWNTYLQKCTYVHDQKILIPLKIYIHVYTVSSDNLNTMIKILLPTFMYYYWSWKFHIQFATSIDLLRNFSGQMK